MVILFTGMSGIDIKNSLKKYKDEITAKDINREPEIIEFETEIETVFLSRNTGTHRSKNIWKDEILTMPYSVLEEYWQEAFDKIYTKIEIIKKETPEKNIFLNLHGCYFHNRTKEYLSLINIEKLKKINANILITLIDDIYEIHHRLTKPGGIYHDDKMPTKTEMVLRHIRLLDWRAKETMMSRFIAKHLKDCRHYILATKHSFDTLTNLTDKKTKSVYLSHPITEVRRLENQKKPVEAKAITEEITRISNLLSSKFATFLPTTIDEYRINFEITNKRTSGELMEIKTYYPVLRKRWEEELYASPTTKLYTKTDFKDLNELWQKKGYNKKDETINQLLTALADIISDQVTVRDYALVEQSEFIVLYRPIFNGNASGGVLEEFNYFLSLKRAGKNAPLCFIYCPQEDVNKFYCKEFTQKIIKEIEELKSFRYLSKIKFEGLTLEEEKKIVDANRDKNLLMDVLDEILFRCSIVIHKMNTKTPLSKDKIKEYKKEFVQKLLQTFEVVDEYQNKASTDLFVGNLMSVDDFFKTVTVFLQSPNK